MNEKVDQLHSVASEITEKMEKIKKTDKMEKMEKMEQTEKTKRGKREKREEQGRGVKNGKERSRAHQRASSIPTRLPHGLSCHASHNAFS